MFLVHIVFIINNIMHSKKYIIFVLVYLMRVLKLSHIFTLMKIIDLISNILTQIQNKCMMNPSLHTTS